MLLQWDGYTGMHIPAWADAIVFLCTEPDLYCVIIWQGLMNLHFTLRSSINPNALSPGHGWKDQRDREAIFRRFPIISDS